MWANSVRVHWVGVGRSDCVGLFLAGPRLRPDLGGEGAAATSKKQMCLSHKEGWELWTHLGLCDAALFSRSEPLVVADSLSLARIFSDDNAVLTAGESIPIRLFLSGYELTPTMRDINKKFSVRYYLNLVLVDEEERRYFKQQVRTGGVNGTLRVKVQNEFAVGKRDSVEF